MTEASLRARARTLAATGETAALLTESRELATDAPAMAGAFALAGKDPERAVEIYTPWLATEEAPEAYHLANLAAAYRKIGDADGVYQTVAHLHPWDLDAKERLRAGKALNWARKQGAPTHLRRMKLALLPTFTPGNLVTHLQLGAIALGVELEVHLVDMDLLRAEIYTRDSGLYRFDPDIVVLATTHHDLQPGDVASQAADWFSLWDALLEGTRAQIVQHTFDAPVTEPLGHLAVRGPSLTATAAALNQHLVQREEPRVSLLDYAGEVARFGSRSWGDSRQWFWAKEAVTPAALPVLAEAYLGVLRAVVGKTRKVLVLDLDNTMWGGIVGEDGLEGLSVGPPSVEGEAHRALQLYASALKQRGVLLAVCSKNNPDDAMAPFRELPEMVLTLEDFVAFEASWDPKPQKLRAMAQKLNLGLDSFVFIDDNPAERARMRSDAPEVLTIPVPEDPSGYIEALDRSRAFEVLALSSEDGQRTAAYRAESKRKEIRSVASPEDYYRSLEMVAQIEPFGPSNQARVVQLAARSNQFNLTTWRISPSDFSEIASSQIHFGRALRLSDRFGEYGLVMVMVAEKEATSLEITALFMSCRVIARTVETLALAELENIATANGCTELIGIYRPTKKNKVLVAELYGRLGFECIDSQPDGATRWRKAVDPDALTHNPFIRIGDRE